MGLTSFQASLAYSLISSIAALVVIRWEMRAILWLCIASIVFSIVGYLQPWNWPNVNYTLGHESTLLVAMMGGTLLSGVAAFRSSIRFEGVHFIGMLAVLAMFERFGVVQLRAASQPIAEMLSYIGPAYCFGIVTVWLGRTKEYRFLRFAGLVAMIWTGFAYIDLASQSRMTFGLDSIVIIMMMSGLVFAGATSLRETDEHFRSNVIGIFGSTISVLVYRLIYVLTTRTSLHFADSDALAVGAITVMLLSAILIHRTKWFVLLAHGWVSAIFVSLVIQGLDGEVVHSYPRTTLIEAVALGVLGGLAFVTWQTRWNRIKTVGLSIVTAWIILSRLCLDLAHLPGMRMQEQAALTLGWTLLAIGLMTVGFRFKVPVLRYWGIGVFALTLGKVFAFDLANLDPGIRVCLLLLLGIGMIGAGYWYIRMKGSGDLTSDESQTPQE